MKLVGVANTTRLEEEPEDEYYLRLEDTGIFINLWACDKNGENLSRGMLLSIEKSNKRIMFPGCIDPKLGFPLDASKRLVINR